MNNICVFGDDGEVLEVLVERGSAEIITSFDGKRDEATYFGVDSSSSHDRHVFAIGEEVSYSFVQYTENPDTDEKIVLPLQEPVSVLRAGFRGTPHQALSRKNLRIPHYKFYYLL